MFKAWKDAISLLESTTAGKDLLEQLRQLKAQRDAANALVDRLAGALEGVRSGLCYPDEYRTVAEAALAEVTKSLSHRTTENTKPQ